MAMTVAYSNFCGLLAHENRGGTKSAYVPDTLGSSSAVLDNTGSGVYEAQYWPYGEPRSEAGSNSSPWNFAGFLGYFRDIASLLYVRARQLALAHGLWSEVDPIWPLDHPYSYARNNPTTHTDPSGQMPGCQGLLPPLTDPITQEPIEFFPVPPSWPGKWPSGKPADPCWRPAPGHFKPIGPGKSCDRYLAACHRGSILACNMYYVCMGAGWQGGIS